MASMRKVIGYPLVGLACLVALKVCTNGPHSTRPVASPTSAVGVGSNLNSDATNDAINEGSLPVPAPLVERCVLQLAILSEETRQPLRGATVELTQRRNRLLGDVSASSDARGIVRLHATDAGPWDVRVRCPGFRDGELEGVELPLNRQFTLARGMRLTGRVIDTRGEPVNDAVVSLEARRVDFFAGFELKTLPTSGTNEHGEFVLDGLPMLAAATLYAMHDEFLPGRSSHLRFYPVRENDPVEIVLTSGAAIIEGVVLDPSGVPHPGATVSICRSTDSGPLQREFESRDRRVGANGEFRFGSLHAGGYELYFSAPGRGGFRTDPIAVALGETVVRNLQFEPSERTVSGRVTDPTGQPLEGIRVTPKNAFEQSSETGPDGRFSQCVYESCSEFYFSGPSHTPRTVAIQPSSSELNVVLNPLHRVWTRLVNADPDGSELFPPSAALLAVEVYARKDAKDDEGVIFVERWVERSARERISFLAPAGTVRVEVTAEGYVPSSVLAELSDGMPLEVEIPLSRGATVSGRVIDADTGAPVSNASIALASNDGFSPHSATEFEEYLSPTHCASDGSFQFSGVRQTNTAEGNWRAPHEYEIWARAEGYALSRSPPFVVPLGNDGPEGMVLKLRREARLSVRLNGWNLPERVLVPSSSVDLFGASRAVDNGAPMSLAQVLGIREQVYGCLHGEEAYTRTFEVSAEGTVELDGLSAGNYSIAVLSAHREITLREGEHRSLELDLLGKPMRRLRLVQGGVPVVGADIHGDLSVTTDQEGFMGWLVEGEWELWIQLKDSDQLLELPRIEVAAGHGPLDVELPAPGAYAVLEVVGPRFSRAGAWRILIVSASASVENLGVPAYSESRTLKSSEPGKRYVGPVPPGVYRIALIPGPGSPPVLSEPVELRVDHVPHVQLHSGPSVEPRPFALQVRGRNGVTVEGRIHLYQPHRSFEFGADGFVAELQGRLGENVGLVEPKYKSGIAHQWFNVRLPLTEPFEVTVGEGGSIDVEVVDASGVGASGADLSVFLPSGLDIATMQFGGLRTNLDGRLRIGPIGAGDYSVQARFRERRSQRLSISLSDGVVNRLRLVLAAEAQGAEQ